MILVISWGPPDSRDNRHPRQKKKCKKRRERLACLVVTEFGIAQLKGKSINQRVIELCQIAHPDFRAALIEAAKKNHYIFIDQLPPLAEDLIFIEEYKSRRLLKNGKVMSVRPLLPSDEIAYRNFFYSLQKETIYLRFFHSVTIFSRKMAQDHWATIDYRQNISLIGVVQNRGNKEIIAIGTNAKMDEQWAADIRIAETREEVDIWMKF